jgi:hypothetical protein
MTITWGRRARWNWWKLGLLTIAAWICGHGDMVVLKGGGKNWKINKRCGGWVS